MRKSPRATTPRESTDGHHAGQNRLEEAAARDETLDNVGRNAAAQSQDDVTEAGIKSLAKLNLALDITALTNDDLFYYKNKPRIDTVAWSFQTTASSLAAAPA